jgi:DNA mismatch repair protein MutL
LGKIIRLDEQLSNKIAAGEVVERPASVVKELLENAIDANSTIVEIEIEEAGLGKIRILDNGDGIEQDECHK